MYNNCFYINWPKSYSHRYVPTGSGKKITLKIKEIKRRLSGWNTKVDGKSTIFSLWYSS